MATKMVSSGGVLGERERGAEFHTSSGSAQSMRADAKLYGLRTRPEGNCEPDIRKSLECVLAWIDEALNPKPSSK